MDHFYFWNPICFWTEHGALIGALGEMPDFRQLENPNTNLASQIISSDNKILGKFHFGENRIPIQFDDLPKNLVDALIATEDERFYSHSGIDFKGTLRAIVFFRQKRGGEYNLSTVSPTIICRYSVQKYIRNSDPKNKRVGNCHPPRTSIYQRRNHSSIFQHL